MASMIPTAVLVTRGDVDLEPALSTIPHLWPRIIWNNSERPIDMKVFGHFAALPEVETEYVYFQDDDAVCPAADLLLAWDEVEHADKILLNEAVGQTPWVSWGGICHRDLPMEAIDRYVSAYGWSEDVLLWCDLIFALLTPHVYCMLGWQNLPWARAENRMCMSPDHYKEQQRIRELVAAL